ncbi:MAG TPA: hypothetical protein VLW75_11560, partial [Rhizomicrobium sp.]|nr:hypothetical protein [Rhizomicrobium sp.]
MQTRGQLDTLLDRYTKALAARNAQMLPLAPAVRFTENAQEIALDEGLWATATGASKDQIRFIDPNTQQAGLMGVFAEHGEPVQVTVRLKLDGEGRIAEIEQFAVRKRPSLFNSDNFAPPALFHDIAPSARAARAELEQTPHRYFNGIERDDGGIIPVRDDCIRIENGVQTVLARESDFASSTASQGFNLFKMGVAEQIGTGFFAFLPRIRDRRIGLIDEERSMVLAVCVFDHPGRLTEVNV